ncbi:Major facilitator superfamily domain general substrate transporter [Penicillium macrosclerotiorum]|uniref:Major facilitator superfamily domain general substrate transporter n=1 Tax=Penicillium macrosclerotiorum TaxID=303699 RepID=UPI00254666F7|nr:Major facilitator superfamily domain general substrate transporter [Penicillium macrosclerotiorum]KAJ5691869.1 Major facilitator superfamily domain general substrate transporter [Penicillium macrosclerotiorum]
MHIEPKVDASDIYPEGGLRANLVVLGSFSSILGGLGLMNSIGIYQAWISTHQLSSLSEGQIGWIFGLYNFLVFFCGIQIGPIFDAKGPRLLMWFGSALIVLTFILIGFCTAYWHFLVVVGILGGMGTSFIFIVPVASIGHYFCRRRGAATGLALSGGSIGGVIFPLVLENLAPRIGFAWSTRIIGLITLILLIPGCLLVRAKFPLKAPSPPSAKVFLPDLTILKDPVLALTTLGVFFIEWGFFIPLEYIASYALASGISPKLSYLMVVFLNAGSFPGRWLPGILADRIGRFNTLLLTNILCLVAVLGIWMPAEGNLVAVVIFSVVFGFASGSNISLVPVCVGELCPVQNYGRYYTTVYTIVSFGALTGVPIAGEILHRCHGAYWGLIAFAGCAYAAGIVCFSWVMWLQRQRGEKA